MQPPCMGLATSNVRGQVLATRPLGRIEEAEPAVMQWLHEAHPSAGSLELERQGPVSPISELNVMVCLKCPQAR